MKSVILLLALGLFQKSIVTDGYVPVRVVAMGYPLLAVGARLQGTIKLEVILTTEGDVADVRTSGTASQVLAEAARSNIRKWKFGTLGNGRSQERKAVVTYLFRFEGASSGKLNESFVFEYPGTVSVTSEMPCSDHLPCPEDRLRLKNPN